MPCRVLSISGEEALDRDDAGNLKVRRDRNPTVR